MDLFLFTNTFPYKKGEPFLINEFEFTKKYFSSIAILSFYGEIKDSYFLPDSQVDLIQPVLKSPRENFKIFLSGFFNLAPIGFHVKDFFKQKIFLAPDKLYWFLTSLMMTRLILSSKSYKEMLRRIAVAENPVLYFYWGDNMCWTVPYMLKKLNHKSVKIVIRLHRADLYEDLKNNYAPFRTEIFSRADVLVPVSLDGKSYLDKHYPAFKDKVFLSRLGVFDHGSNPVNNENEYCVISVSNIVAVKRVHLIFEALRNSSKKITWHHFGDGAETENLKKLLNSAPANLKVKLHGFTENRDLIKFYQNQKIDLFMNVSTSEGLPVSIMEALSFAVPVIATNVGGTAELVNSDVGELIDVNTDATTLAKKIDRILSLDPEKKQMMRNNAKRNFENKVNALHNYPQFYDTIISLNK
jgi:glycosyltransferase involved in cell wall biosynthesis